MTDKEQSQNKVSFISEFSEVKSRKTANLDKQYTVKFQGGDQNSMLIDLFDSEVALKVTVEPV